MHKHIIGWDVGGAHLKAALLSSSGELLQVLQVPCALWRGLNELELAIEIVMQQFKSDHTYHAITMTGELVDLFDSRQQGVLAISRAMQEKLSGEKQFYFANLNKLNLQKQCFLNFSQVAQHWQKVASANWFASAELIAQQVNNALLIDIGSTTTDFILIQNSQVACLGFTDAERMQSQELVYTGVVRTPLMAITQQVKFAKVTTTTAAEHFATTADVYRLTNDLPTIDDIAETADGNDKSLHASARRLARMIGRDVEDASFVAWLDLAQEFKAQQLTRLKHIAQAHTQRANDIQRLQVIGAGVGRFLVKEIAIALGLNYLEATLNSVQNPKLGNSLHFANVCFPAYAVANLAYQQCLANV